MIYIVEYGGGRGPDVWDDHREIEAESLREALDIAEPIVVEAGGVIFSIEQKD